MTINGTTNTRASSPQNEMISPDHLSEENKAGGGGGGCPVKRSPSSASQNPTAGNRTSWTSWLRLAATPPSTTTGDSTTSSSTAVGSLHNGVSEGGGGCPVKHSATSTSSSQFPLSEQQQHRQPTSIEEAARHAQTPQADQTIPLST